MNMPIAVDFFLHYVYLILFFWVLAEQLGAPIPSIPLLLTAGTLTATHKVNLWMALFVILLACAISDSIWYFLGQKFGGTVVKLLCRFSMESSTCVRKTNNYFTRHGAKALLVAKFVPGLSTVAAPIAGQTGMPYGVFLASDMAGALFWSLSIILAGRFFGDALKKNPHVLSTAGHFAGLLFVLLLIGFVLYRVLKQQAFLKSVRGSKIEPEELKEMLDSGQSVFIIDLRHPLDYLPDPRVLPGAVRIGPETVAQHKEMIPRDRDVVLYCTCPSEATSGKVALNLRKQGIYRVRPLRGGFDEWKRLGFPLEAVKEEAGMHVA
jgi:membrane protein DedA with SNARE-associated domain/rhodanese-related sulfurtransferase